MEPELSDFGHKLVESAKVIRNGMITQPSPNHARQPTPRLADTIMPSSTKLNFDRSQCSAEPLATSASPENETLVLSSLPTDVSKPEELKRLARLPTFPRPAIRRSASKLQQSRFVGVQFQAELFKPLFQCIKTGSGIDFVFKSDYESSSPGELHPQALTEPDVNLSAHPALMIRSHA